MRVCRVPRGNALFLSTEIQQKGPRGHPRSLYDGFMWSDECPSCLSRHIHVRQQDAEFFARCDSCGREGPRAADTFHALYEWRKLCGRRPPSSEATFYIVLLGLTGLGLLISLAAWMAS